MMKLIYITAVCVLLFSCKNKTIMSSIPTLMEIPQQSSLADNDLLNQKINYQQYLKIKSIQNSINHGTFAVVNGLTYSDLLEKHNIIGGTTGFNSAKYEGYLTLSFSIDSTLIAKNGLDVLINLGIEKSNPIYIDELILVVEDILGKQLKIFVYSCPLEILPDQDYIFGATIETQEIIEGFNRQNFKIKIDEEKLLESLNFKVFANQLQSKSTNKTIDLQYYYEPSCALSAIINEYNPIEEERMYNKRDTLKETIYYLNSYTCK